MVACLALAACTRDYDDLFSEAALADGGGADVRADVVTNGDGGPPSTIDGSDARIGEGGGDAGVDACTSCTGGACDIVCAAGCPCTSNRVCTTPECRFVCESGQTCIVESTDTSGSASTTVTCKAGSTCEVTCGDPPCTLTCEGDAKCKITCENTSNTNDCVVNCPTSVVGGCSNSGGALRRACNDICPPG